MDKGVVNPATGKKVPGKLWQPSKDDRLCSIHFAEECFYIAKPRSKPKGERATENGVGGSSTGDERGRQRQRNLKKGSIPTLFAHRKPINPRKHTEKRLRKQVGLL